MLPALVVGFRGGTLGLLLLPVAISVVIIVVFGTLTVVLDERRLSLRFGAGLIRKTIPVSDIRGFTSVRNPWYYGWGIRFTPAGRLYNVSGFSAVDLLLNSGRHIRIGTDEPAALQRALTHLLGERPAASEPQRVDRSPARTLVAVVLAGALALAAIVAALLYVGLEPPAVSLSPTTFSVHAGGFYAAEIPYSEISEISLQDTIPRVVRKTNGFNAGNTLRGHFRLEVIGDGQVFINRGVPPYLVLKIPGSFIIVNFTDPERTRAVYADLRRHVAAK